MKIHTVEQASPEWFAARKGLLTASNADTIAANGKGLETYIVKLLAEEYSSAEPEEYSNEHTDRGQELEDQCITMYELENGVEVVRVGFVECDGYGASPDGLVGEDGLIEVKCPKDTVYMKILLTGVVDSAYVWQTQMQLLVTERQWCDLVFYNPNFAKSSYIVRIKPDTEKVEKLKIGIAAGKAKIAQLKNIYNQSK